MKLFASSAIALVALFAAPATAQYGPSTPQPAPTVPQAERPNQGEQKSDQRQVKPSSKALFIAKPVINPDTWSGERPTNP